jgi:hypothetical protein
MSSYQTLDADDLLRRMATQIPEPMRPNIVVIGSIATAWAFRDLSGSGAVATKDIDLLLQPAADAVATAASLGGSLLAEGWRPHFPGGRTPGTADTPDNSLPALRLVPPMLMKAGSSSSSLSRHRISARADSGPGS